MYGNFLYTLLSGTLFFLTGLASVDAAVRTSSDYIVESPNFWIGITGEIDCVDLNVIAWDGPALVELERRKWSDNDAYYFDPYDRTKFGRKESGALFEEERPEGDDILQQAPYLYYFLKNTFPPYSDIQNRNEFINDGSYIATPDIISDVRESEPLMDNEEMTGFSSPLKAEKLDFGSSPDESLLKVILGGCAGIYGNLDEAISEPVTSRPTALLNSPAN